SFKGYHYEFQLGASDKVWKNWDALVTATKAKELFWAPGTSKDVKKSGPTWIAKDLKIKLVANPGYELKSASGKANETPVTSVDISKFSSFKRLVTKKLIDDIYNEYDKKLRVTGDTHAMSWSSTKYLEAFYRNRGIWEWIYEMDNSRYFKPFQLPQSIDSSDDLFLIKDSNRSTRSISLFSSLKLYTGFILQKNLNIKQHKIKNTGWDTLPMYIDTTPINMNPELSGTTTAIADLVEHNSPLTGYTPDFLYSIDNGQHWITKDELMKLYDGSDVNKNLWTPGTKTEKGKWLASTNGNILVKLKPAKYTVLSTDK
ncbi:MAG: hypothetical protein GY679_00305, partial [Mycoplasma sp.]|nr:hypothetical protein [Mycoplasma sp.]